MAIITKFFKGAGYSDKNNVRYIARTTFVQIRTPHSERYYLVSSIGAEIIAYAAICLSFCIAFIIVTF